MTILTCLSALVAAVVCLYVVLSERRQMARVREYNTLRQLGCTALEAWQRTYGRSGR